MTRQWGLDSNSGQKSPNSGGLLVPHPHSWGCSGGHSEPFCKGRYEFAILEVLGYLCNPTFIPPAVTRTLATNKSGEEGEKWFGATTCKLFYFGWEGGGLFSLRHLLISLMSTKASLTDSVLNLCDYYFFCTLYIKNKLTRIENESSFLTVIAPCAPLFPKLNLEKSSWGVLPFCSSSLFSRSSVLQFGGLSGW